MSEAIEEKEKVIARAKSAIDNLLKELNITKICYVDDKCSINELREYFIGNLINLHSKKPSKSLFVDWSLPMPVFQNRVKSIWDSSDEENRRELYLELLKFQGDEEGLSNSVAPLRLKKHLKRKIELYSPTEWINAKDDIIQEINDESKILCLFDIDFGSAPLPEGDRRDGRDLAVEMLSDETINNNVFCGIFSHLFSIDEENEKRDEYCKSHDLEKGRFYTISKKRFVDDSYLPGLAEGIKNTLRINEVELLKEVSTKTLKKSFNKAIKEIKGLKPDSFNHIIQKSSKKEGVWEIFTLIRLNNILTTKSALEAFTSKKTREAINAKLDKIRKIEKIKTGALTPTDSSETNALRQKELYLDSNILNSLHFPISNGDIFKIKDQEYILLAQPCNLMVRDKGYRGSRARDYDTGFLLKIETITYEVYSRYTKNQLDTIYFLEDKSLDGEYCRIIRFSTFKAVSLKPLDLTVFNTDGISKINLKENESSSSTLQESWKRRYKILYIHFNEYRETLRIFKRLRSKEKRSLEHAVLYGKLFNGYDIDNQKLIDFSGYKLEFDIKRISKLESSFASDLLQNFMSYLSRNAFEHDFTR